MFLAVKFNIFLLLLFFNYWTGRSEISGRVMAGSIIVGIVTKPLTVLKWACLFGLRTAFILCITWTELVMANISFHFTLIWKMIVWALALLSLPFRLLTAISRESQVPLASLFSSASYYVSSLTPFHVFLYVCFQMLLFR